MMHLYLWVTHICLCILSLQAKMVSYIFTYGLPTFEFAVLLGSRLKTGKFIFLPDVMLGL
jgi:hypothetical protein